MANDDALSRLPTSTMLPSDSGHAREIIVFTDQLDDPLRKVTETIKKRHLTEICGESLRDALLGQVIAAVDQVFGLPH